MLPQLTPQGPYEVVFAPLLPCNLSPGSLPVAPFPFSLSRLMKRMMMTINEQNDDEDEDDEDNAPAVAAS